jgi:hypothetical protein
MLVGPEQRQHRTGHQHFASVPGARRSGCRAGRISRRSTCWNSFVVAKKDVGQLDGWSILLSFKRAEGAVSGIFFRGIGSCSFCDQNYLAHYWLGFRTGATVFDSDVFILFILVAFRCKPAREIADRSRRHLYRGLGQTTAQSLLSTSHQQINPVLSVWGKPRACFTQK